MGPHNITARGVMLCRCALKVICKKNLLRRRHNMIQIHNNVPRDWHYSTEYSYIFPHLIPHNILMYLNNVPKGGGGQYNIVNALGPMGIRDETWNFTQGIYLCKAGDLQLWTFITLPPSQGLRQAYLKYTCSLCWLRSYSIGPHDIWIEYEALN